VIRAETTHNLHRRRPRTGLHRAHIRHQRTLRLAPSAQIRTSRQTTPQITGLQSHGTRQSDKSQVKGIPAAGLETAPPPPSIGDGGAAAFLHGPSRLFGSVVALPSPDGTPDTDTAATGSDHDQPGQGASG
jgi:hypothetical protein